jgi:hypothetical protein
VLTSFSACRVNQGVNPCLDIFEAMLCKETHQLTCESWDAL